MTRQRAIFIAKSAAVLSVPLVLWAHSAGPDPGYSNVPGELGTCAAAGCHGGTPNSGPGSVKVTLAGTAYVPGVKQRITVTVSDPNQRRWGFQLTARQAGDATKMAGTFTPIDGNTQRVCGDKDWFGVEGCPAGRFIYEYIEHTTSGTRMGTTGGVSFDFDWTPPAADVGPIDFYAAGNAANGDANNTGDRIYSTKATLTPGAAAPKPAISQNGVVNGGSFKPGIAPNTWVTILGTNLASNTRIWQGSDFVGNKLPASLDGTSAKINGKDAFVYFISPGQLNVLAPVDTATGPVSVTVTTPGGTSDAGTATLAAVSPAFFIFNNDKYIAATHANGSLLGPPTLFAGATTPAVPGEIVVLYGTGFGQTNPAIPNGEIIPGVAPLVTKPAIRIGGITVAAGDISFAGQSATGLYQVNVKVPDTLADGDHEVILTAEGVSSPAGAFINVKK